MNHLKKLICAAVFFIGVPAAQAQKIAHLSLDSLIAMMPETKTASEAANEYLKGLESELVAMQTEFQKKYQDYMEKEAGMSDMIKKNKQDDLQQLQNRIQDFQQKAEMDFKMKQAQLTLPILDKAKKGIEMVAKESGYRYVLDTSKDRTSVLYSEQGEDILLVVKKKLDSMPLASIPGTTPPAGIKMPPPAGNAKPSPKK